jgi:hypothetical protein
MTLKDLLDTDKAAISLTEAADLLGCDRRTLSRTKDTTGLVYIQVGRRCLVLVKPLLTLLGY